MLEGKGFISRPNVTLAVENENILLKANAASYVDVNDIHSKA